MQKNANKINCNILLKDQYFNSRFIYRNIYIYLCPKIVSTWRGLGPTATMINTLIAECFITWMPRGHHDGFVVDLPKKTIAFRCGNPHYDKNVYSLPRERERKKTKNKTPTTCLQFCVQYISCMAE